MKLLERHFEIALETPNGIKKIRKLILTLAMQGKIVRQDPKELTANDLYGKISLEKEKLIKEGKLKTFKPLPRINPDEPPYELPKSWAWFRLGDLCSKITDGEHQTPPRVKHGKRLLSAKNVRDGYIDYNNCDFISEEHYINSRKRCRPEIGDLLIISVGGTIGRTSLIVKDDQFAIVRSVALIKPLLMDSNYLRYAMNSDLLQKIIHKRSRGGAQPCLYLSEIEKFILPLPPLAEQKRIVAKIDQLMALCDKLEAERDARNNKRLKIHTAAINKLLSASDKSGFNTSWNFIAKNFNELYSVPENVEELKKAILQLAMMGKLVPQDPNDQPASELLKEIEAKKKQLIIEGKIRSQEPFPDIKPEAIPYGVPKRWEWVRLGDISLVLMGQSPDGKTYNETGNGVPLINGPVEFGGKGPFDKTVAIKFTTAPTKMCQQGDLLLCVRGSTTGRTNIAGFDSCIGRGVASLRPFIFNSYFNYFILSNRQNLFDAGKGSTFPNISYERIASFYFPLPPLAEQKLIATKIDQLMFLCNNLKQQINDSTNKQTAILNAVLSKL